MYTKGRPIEIMQKSNREKKKRKLSKWKDDSYQAEITEICNRKFAKIEEKSKIKAKNIVELKALYEYSSFSLCFICMGHTLQLKFKQLKACLGQHTYIHVHMHTNRTHTHTPDQSDRQAFNASAAQIPKPKTLGAATKSKRNPKPKPKPSQAPFAMPRMMESVLCRCGCNRISHKY